MIALMVLLVGKRSRQPHAVPWAEAAGTADSPPSGSLSAGGESTAGGSGAAGTAGSGPVQDDEPSGGLTMVDDGVFSAARDGAPGLEAITLPNLQPSPPVRLLDRPLRLVALDWEVVAPAVVANRGLNPGEGSLFRQQGLEVHLRVVPGIVDLERALARGGADQEGADIALLPLPLLAKAQEPLRALALQVFFVVSWSHGREVVASSQPQALLSLPRTGQVRLVAEPGMPPHFLALFLLDLAGVPPERVTVVSPSEPTAASVSLSALSRRGPQEGDESRRNVVATTAEATRLIPYVAVAPQGLIESQPEALTALCAAWLSGIDELKRDVPKAARQLASASGAPDALELLGSLGQLQHATLDENTRVSGLAGRRVATVDALFVTTWRLWRGAGVVTSPMPSGNLVTPRVIAGLVRRGAPSNAPGAPQEAGTLRTDTEDSAWNEQSPLVLVRLEGQRLDEAAVEAKVGWLADIFAPLSLRLVLPTLPESQAQELITQTRERFELEAGRLSVTRRVAGRRAGAAIEVLPRVL